MSPCFRTHGTWSCQLTSEWSRFGEAKCLLSADARSASCLMDGPWMKWSADWVSLPVPARLARVSREYYFLTGESSYEARHACALAENGRVYCWGANRVGQRGRGHSVTGRASLGPVLRSSTQGPHALTSVVEIALGMHHSCAIVEGGDVWCWGYNAEGQVGRETVLSPSPWATRVPRVSRAIRLQLGHRHSCALTLDREVWCWGATWARGHIRDERPRALEFEGEPRELIARADYTCVLTTDGHLWCWGSTDRIRTRR